MRPIRFVGGLAAVALLVACGDEGPVALDELVPDDLIETMELVLDASEFLVADTSISGFVAPTAAGYLVVAGEDEGGLDVHGLIRFQRPPTQITYVDSAGATQTDSNASPIGGELMLVLDTLQTRASGPFEIALSRVEEAWDPWSATWDLRIDSAGVREPWSEPGARGGAAVGMAAASAGMDTVRIPVDSATMALWGGANVERTVRVSIPTPGARVQVRQAQLSASYRPEARPDTVVTLNVSNDRGSFIYSSDPSTEGRLLVGGTPTWRTFFHFRERLDTLSVPCPGAADGCSMRLADATISYAALQLQPVGLSPGYTPVDTVALELRPVFGTDQIPLSRAPLGDRLGALTRIAPQSFEPEGAPVEVPITSLVSALASRPESNAVAPPTTLALLEAPEAGQFGLAGFGRIASGPAAPRLRIIVSVTREAVLP